MSATVLELLAAASPGQTRIYAPTVSLTGLEPKFYSVMTRGEFPEHPRWVNRPALGTEPAPALYEKLQSPLSPSNEFRFEIDATRSTMSDFYSVGVGVFLISHRLLSVLANVDPFAVQHERIEFCDKNSSSIGDYRIAIPSRSLDAVDTGKTEVTVRNAGEGRSTVISYKKGYHLREDDVAPFATFSERFTAHWLWRPRVFESARSAGVVGLLGVPTTGMNAFEEIRV